VLSDSTTRCTNPLTKLYWRSNSSRKRRLLHHTQPSGKGPFLPARSQHVPQPFYLVGQNHKVPILCVGRDSILQFQLKPFGLGYNLVWRPHRLRRDLVPYFVNDCAHAPPHQSRPSNGPLGYAHAPFFSCNHLAQRRGKNGSIG
jgi:hypothetical protein